MAQVQLEGEEFCCELSFIRGIAVLHGRAVDEAGKAGLNTVPKEWQAKRGERDGDSFHITFLTKSDLQTVATQLRNDELEALEWNDALQRPDPEDYASIVRTALQLLSKEPASLDWIDAGEGRAQDDGGEAVFRVVLWPAGTAVRRALGLPSHDFHISLGFRGHDVHGKGKGLASLVNGAPSATAARQLTALATRLTESGIGCESGIGNDVSMLTSQAAELADAALLGATACDDVEGQKLAHRTLCQVNGKLKKNEAVLAHADRLLELDENDESSCRFRAFALTMLGRYKEALPAIARAQTMLDELEDSELHDATEKLNKAADLCRKKMATSSGNGKSDANGVNDDINFEHDFLETRKLKFPSTPHLKDLGAATRDDKHLDPSRVKKFCGSGRMVTVEEKIDGANLGISLDSQYRPRLQGRSKWVNWESDYQFRGLEEWLSEHASALCEVLERNRDILFGEWCAYRHTVEYTKLPCYFLAFDIYDKHVGRFLSRRAFHTRLQNASGAKIAAVPLVTHQSFASVAEVEQLLASQSKFGTCPLEGVYLRLDEEAADSASGETYLEDRCKLVRPEFQQSIVEGGTWRGMGKNDLDMELAWTYAEQSHVFAQSAVSVEGQSASSSADATCAAKAKDNYPKTPHVPFSPGVNSDDTSIADCTALLMQEVIVSEKLDGGNCCIKNGFVYARTHGQPATHESFSAIKQLVHDFPAEVQDVELFGENMTAVHSIEYGNLSSYFYLFAVRKKGNWLSWDDVVVWAEKLGIPTVPLVFRGTFESPTQLQSCLETWAKEPSAVGSAVNPEGFVVRRVASFGDEAFRDCIAKYVRAGHIQTDETWKRRWKKARLGLELPKRAPRSLGNNLRMQLNNPRTRHNVTVPGMGEVKLPRNFSFLLDEVAVSSTPNKRDQIVAMASMGISLVITLTEETPLPPEWFEGTNVQNIFVPVPNYYPPTVAQTDAILQNVAEIAASGHKIMVHCGGGKGRAGTVAACVILRHGISNVQQSALCQMQSDEVITFLREARPGSVETDRQERFIREYASLLWQRAAEAPEAPPLERELSRQRSVHEEESLVGSDLFGDASEAAGSMEEPKTSQRKVGAKAKRAEKDLERMRKETQKRAPKYLLTCGLAASGKSTFSCALERSGNWIRANQDDLGRKGCIDVVSKTVPLVRKGASHLVVDRCNPTRVERKEWLDLIGRPPASEVVCVFFDSNAEDCKKRAAARFDHPTIRPGGGGRIIDDQAKKFERPEKSEGFGSVEVVKSFEDADKLLRRYGIADTSVPDVSSSAASTSGSGYAPVSFPTAGCEESTSRAPLPPPEEAPPPTTEPENTNSLARTRSDSLPPRFYEWLKKSLCEELTAADAEGILAAVEVILTCKSEDDNLEEQLDAACEVLQDSGAPECAAALAAQWHATTRP